MKHEMHLHNEPFKKIKLGTKKVEGRILDEKRQKIKVGDEIIFEDRETRDTISVIVTNLEKFGIFRKCLIKLIKQIGALVLIIKKENLLML